MSKAKLAIALTTLVATVVWAVPVIGTAHQLLRTQSVSSVAPISLRNDEDHGLLAKGWINGAGPYHRVNLFDETIAGWREMFDGNLHPIFYLARAAAPGMKARKYGRIISFSMANADQMEAQPDVTAHYIAKAGVLILTRTLAKLLAPHGITVNAISPGFIDSGSAPPGELAAVVKRIPAGYIGTVDDTVGAVRYLLSPDARYVNGANIQVSGGWGI